MSELEGYKTQDVLSTHGCDGCAFYDEPNSICRMEDARCIPESRSDGRNVIFIKVENDDR